MLKEALQKLQAEIAANTKNKYAAVVGSFMMERVRNHPEDAEKVIDPLRTIAGSLGAMKEAARKDQHNGSGVLTDEEGFAVVLKYYGVSVPEEVPASSTTPSIGLELDLDSLLDGYVSPRGG